MKYLFLIGGSVTLTYGFGSEGTFPSFFKEKKFIKKSQNTGNLGFSYYFSLMMEGSGTIHIMTDPNSEGPKHPDRNPHHWYHLFL